MRYVSEPAINRWHNAVAAGLLVAIFASLTLNSCEEGNNPPAEPVVVGDPVMRDVLFDDDKIPAASVDAIYPLVDRVAMREGFTLTDEQLKYVCSEALILYKKGNVTLATAIVTAVKRAVPE